MTQLSGDPNQPRPTFEKGAAHQERPRLRPIRGFPAQAQSPDGKSVQVLGLADARQVSEKMVFTMPAAQFILPLMDGSRTLDQIVAEVGRGLARPFLEELVAQLDEACLVEGPRFEALRQKVRDDFDSHPTLPPAGSAAFADALVIQAHGKDASDQLKVEKGPELIRKIFDQWMAKALEAAENPSIDKLPKAIMAPHLDYGRGWMNYAAIYGRLRVCERPDRVVILGTNHFGESTGVCACDKGYQTPLGTCEIDGQLLAQLRSELGEALLKDRFDHEHEHSIELQVPWIQHIFGKDERGAYPKVLGILVHDPSVNNGQSYDGAGVALEPFVAALRKAITNLPGKTLIISSADLSHAGPAFGDQQALVGEGPEVEQARNRVVQQDQEMLEFIRQNRPAELISSMAWQQNPTRWCSIGNIAATLMIAQPATVQLLNYAAALDQQGHTMVSSAAAVMD